MNSRFDAVEALTNAVAGVVISVLITWLVLGFTPAQSLAVTAVFFFASMARAYVLRRIFRRMAEKAEPQHVAKTFDKHTCG